MSSPESRTARSGYEQADADLIQLIRDERDIERTLTILARAMDERDWATMAQILADNAEADFGTGRLEGSTAIIQLVRSFLDNCGPTQHLLGNVIITVGDDAATSRAYIHDVHLNSAAKSATRFYTLGDYHDTWQRSTDGTWRLTERIKANHGYVGPMEIFEQ